MDIINGSFRGKAGVLEMTVSTERILGRIEAKVDRLVEDMDALNAKRSESSKRIDVLEDNQKDIERALKNIDKRLANVETPVAYIRKWHQRAIGATILISIAAALLGGTIANYWQKIVAGFK